MAKAKTTTTTGPQHAIKEDKEGKPIYRTQYMAWANQFHFLINEHGADKALGLMITDESFTDKLTHPWNKLAAGIKNGIEDSQSDAAKRKAFFAKAAADGLSLDDLMTKYLSD